RVSPEILLQERERVREKLIHLGVPRDVLIGITRHTLMRNKAFDWVDTNMSQKESLQFYANLDSFMRGIEMWAAKHHELFPDTIETLSILAYKGMKMGIVTNTSREAATYLLKKHSLARFFAVVVARNDVKRLKPCSEMIQVAMEQLGQLVGWLVGDSVFDAIAAKDAGIPSIIVRRNGVKPTFDHDYFTSSLRAIASIIKKTGS
ncbi:unnamed protein product, partial [marine sediment metagenome]